MKRHFDLLVYVYSTPDGPVLFHQSSSISDEVALPDAFACCFNPTFCNSLTRAAAVGA